MTKLQAIIISTLALLAVTFFACEDNYDKENPIIGKWRFKKYMADIETNDSTATAIITQDILKINKEKHHIMQYGLMTDSVFVLYDTDSEYKATGRYYQIDDTIKFELGDSRYWAIIKQKEYFNIYHKDISEAYTVDSLRALGVKNPEAVVIKKAWLLIEFKRISS